EVFVAWRATTAPVAAPPAAARKTRSTVGSAADLRPRVAARPACGISGCTSASVFKNRGCAAADEATMRDALPRAVPMLERVTQPPVPSPPVPQPAERLRIAWQERHESDYIF